MTQNRGLKKVLSLACALCLTLSMLGSGTFAAIAEELDGAEAAIEQVLPTDAPEEAADAQEDPAEDDAQEDPADEAVDANAQEDTAKDEDDAEVQDAAAVEPEPQVDEPAEAGDPVIEEGRQNAEAVELMARTTRAGPKQVDATVTNFRIQNLFGQDVNRVFLTDSFYLAMDWDASAHGADLHPGDYFDITLPDEMIFPSTSPATDFDIYGPDGTTVIATAHINAGATGGTVRVTFSDWVEGKENVNGSIRLASRFSREKVTANDDNTFSVSVGSQVVPTTVTVTGPKELQNEHLSKWGQRYSQDANQAEWWVRINHTKDNLGHVVLKDSLSDGTGTETYDANSFVLIRVEFDPYGDVITVYEPVDVSDKLTIAPDGRSFELDLGVVNGDQYRLKYRTTYVPGTTLKNNNRLESENGDYVYSATHISASSGGSGTGTLANKIKIVKVDAEDGATPIEGAVFEVTAPNGTTFTLTTGADGTVTSGTLTSGTYKVREIAAPDGYVLDDTEHELVVNSEGGAILDATNEPERVDVPVKKIWVGPKAGPVTIRLIADGTDTGKTVELSEDNNWSAIFEGLRKFQPGAGGTEIVYTVEEVPVANYDPAVAGNADSGFTVTNTNTETVSIPVTKAWEDAGDQDGIRPGSITVELYADDVATGKTLTLSEAGNWTGSFTELARYDANDGHEIVYTVKEADAPSGYTVAVSGDAGSGFTVTNSYTPEEISVPVTKTWIGPAGSEVTVRLLADGAETGKTLTITEAGGWAGSFDGLPKYRDGGTEIVYTVEEDPVAGYISRVSGDAGSGFTVTNINAATTEVEGAKTWDDDANRDGVRPASITIRLLANGIEVASATVTEADGWAWSFVGLPRYDASDGREISYTVTEDAVPGYSTSYDGYDVTNTHAPGKTSVTVVKAWDDAGDQDGIRPGSITVELYADDVATGKTLTLSEDNNWMGSFEDLNQKDAGVDIVYTVKEVDVPAGYTVTVTGDATTGFTVTNAHEPSMTRVSVAKAWADGDDADGKRPASVTVRLLADGKDAGRTVELSEANNWVATFADLPEFENGRKIAYTIEEVPVEGYVSKVTGDAASGFVVTNTRETTPPPPSTSAVPKAGDAASATGAWIAALLGGAAVSLLLWRRTRREL